MRATKPQEAACKVAADRCRQPSVRAGRYRLARPPSGMSQGVGGRFAVKDLTK